MSQWKLAFYVSFLGGFIYGYNAEVMAGAVLFIEHQLHLGSNYAEDLISARLWAGLVAIAFSSWLVARFGRKMILLASAAFLTIGPFLDFVWDDFLQIDVSRLITGLGLGLNAVVVLLYITEMAEINYRGKILALYSVAVSLGILCSDGINYLFSYSQNWHMTLGLIVIPSVIQLISLFFIPESTVWLEQKKMSFSNNAPSKFLKDLLPAQEYRILIIVGIIFAALTEAIGLDTLFGYAPTIFGKAGFAHPSTAIAATTAVNMVQLIAGICIIYFIDHATRKRFISFSLIAMGAILLTMAIVFWLIPFSTELAWIVLGLMILLSATYNFAFISVAWIVIAEMFPSQVRATGLALTTLVSYLFAVILAQFYLDIVSLLHLSGAFLLFALICFASTYFVSRYLIETKDLQNT